MGGIILVTRESIFFFSQYKGPPVIVSMLRCLCFGLQCLETLWGIQESELPNAIIFPHQQSCKHGSGEEA